MNSCIVNTLGFSVCPSFLPYSDLTEITTLPDLVFFWNGFF